VRPGTGGPTRVRVQAPRVTNLFAALDVHTGHVYSELSERKRSTEFTEFLAQIDAAIDPAEQITLIPDNISTHNAKAVRAWLDQNPGRFTLVFTPVHASWLNQVEMFFSTLTRLLLRRASFRSLDDLTARIADYITRYNNDAKPYNWTFAGRKRGWITTCGSDH